MEYRVIETELGWVAAGGTAHGLRCVVLPLPAAALAEAKLLHLYPEAQRSRSWNPGLADRLQRYAAGEVVEFLDPIDVPGATPFRRRVWEATRSIPSGTTRTYRWLAEQAGSPNAFRAVGQVMATNPVPIVVPCHRVVGSDGGLCGFGGGLDLKARMLQVERGGVPLPAMTG